MGRGKKFRARLIGAFRWLHIYLSLFGFAAILLFSITGITLNHPQWAGISAERHEDLSGQLDPTWVHLSPTDESPSGDDAVDRLAVAEFLRAEHHLRGAISEFRVDETECLISWRGPGYAADGFVDREDGSYELTVEAHGCLALLNDLHKGRDAGPQWAVLIDLSALLMALSAVTGIVLLLYLRRKRVTGLITVAAGSVLVGAAYWFFVP